MPPRLVEVGAEDSASLEATQQQIVELVSTAKLIRPVEFTSVAEAVELAWHVREGCRHIVTVTGDAEIMYSANAPTNAERL